MHNHIMSEPPHAANRQGKRGRDNDKITANISNTPFSMTHHPSHLSYNSKAVVFTKGLRCCRCWVLLSFSLCFCLSDSWESSLEAPSRPNLTTSSQFPIPNNLATSNSRRATTCFTLLASIGRARGRVVTTEFLSSGY